MNNTSSINLRTYSNHHQCSTWMGDFPNHWKLKPLKYIFTIQDTRLKHDPLVKTILSVSGYDGIVPKNLNGYEGQMPSEDVSEYRIVRENQLVVNTMWLNYTGLGVSSYEGYVSPAYRAYDIGKDIQPRFAHYLLRSSLYVQKYSSLLYGVRPNSLQVKPYDFDRIEVLLPPKKEQTAISNFLDKKLALIDSSIEKKKILIKLLQEKRQALITQAVTKSLDPNVEINISSVRGLSILSKKLNTLPLKRVVSTKITDGPHLTPNFVDEGIPFVSAESVQKNNTLDFNKKRGFISYEDHAIFIKKCKPQRNDIFLVKSGATTGRVAIVDIDDVFSVWSPLALIRANQNLIYPKYLYLFLISQLFQDQVKLSWSFGTQENIGMGVLENLIIIFPKLEIQQMIVNKIETTTNKINTTIKKVEEQVQKIQEFKSALIYNAVTGKIKV